MGDLNSETTIWLTIGFSALATFSLRFGGLMLANKLPRSAKFNRFMEALPGTLLLALIAPGALSSGIWGGIGLLCTAICTYKTRNLFVAMVVGMAVVALGRAIAL